MGDHQLELELGNGGAGTAMKMHMMSDFTQGGVPCGTYMCMPRGWASRGGAATYTAQTAYIHTPPAWGWNCLIMGEHACVKAFKEGSKVSNALSANIPHSVPCLWCLLVATDTRPWMVEARPAHGRARTVTLALWLHAGHESGNCRPPVKGRAPCGFCGSKAERYRLTVTGWLHTVAEPHPPESDRNRSRPVM